MRSITFLVHLVDVETEIVPCGFILVVHVVPVGVVKGETVPYGVLLLALPVGVIEMVPCI